MDEASYYSDSEHSEIAASDIQIPMRNAFTSRRRLERFVGRRRTNSESNNTVDIYRPDHQLALPPSDQTDSVSVDLPNHCQENEDDEEFDSAPELADMELIHRILKRSKQRTLPKRTTSFTSYNINRQVCLNPMSNTINLNSSKVKVGSNLSDLLNLFKIDSSGQR